MVKNFLITGSTGFVGRFIFKRILLEDANNHIYLLIRGSKSCTAKERMLQLFRELFDEEEIKKYRPRVSVIEGNIFEEKFGLSIQEYIELTNKVEYIHHSAATIKFHLGLEEASEINVDGTKRMLEFARACFSNKCLKGFYHISTAYVTGRKIQAANGERLFANTYEKTKYLSELLVKDAIKEGLPITIFRPSIISGDSKTGEITSSNIIYRFLMMLSRNILTTLPCETTLNIIPINNFLDIMFDIIKAETPQGSVYNITNPSNTNFRNLIKHACLVLNTPIPDFLPISKKHLLPKRVFESISVFIPYFEDEHFFDLSKTYSVLGGEKYECDDVILSMGPIVDFCFRNQLLRKAPVTIEAV